MLMRIIFFTSFLVWLSGCGKEDPGRELKIQVKALDKDQQVASMVRKVEVTYQDSQAHEKLRVGSAVSSLGQPVSVKSNLPRDFTWEKTGTWLAQAYTSDGGLLLKGSTQVDNKTNFIEIEMSRIEAKAAVAASRILKSISFLNSGPILYTRLIRMVDIRNDIDGHRCVEIPEMYVDINGLNIPSIIFESTIKDPDLFFELGNSKSTVGPRRIPLREWPKDPMYSALKVVPDFFGNKLLKEDASYTIYLYSGAAHAVFEGCLTFKTWMWPHPETEHSKPIEVSFELSSEGLAFQRPRPPETWLQALPPAKLVLKNPNRRPKMIDVKGVAMSSVDSEFLKIAIQNTGDMTNLDQANFQDEYFETITLKPYEIKELWVLGGLSEKFNMPFLNIPKVVIGWKNRKLKIHWTVIPHNVVADFPIQNRVDEIP